MPNKHYNSHPSGGGASNKAQGSKASASMPEKTAAWPGLPGKGGPSRSGGTDTSGPIGPFYVKKEGL